MYFNKEINDRIITHITKEKITTFDVKIDNDIVMAKLTIDSYSRRLNRYYGTLEVYIKKPIAGKFFVKCAKFESYIYADSVPASYLLQWEYPQENYVNKVFHTNIIVECNDSLGDLVWKKFGSL